MNFLIIDDDESIYFLLKKQIENRWPESIVNYYNPVNAGLPHKDFNWSDYDILLLDYDIGLSNFTGLDIISRMQQHERYPIIIMITGDGDEKLAVKAIQSGADDYLVKYDILTDKLYSVIDDAIKIKSLTGYPGSNNIEDPDDEYYDDVLAIPGYRNIKLINYGTSYTFSANSINTGQKVAIKLHKILDDSDDLSIKRFQQELFILADINHPNIIKIVAQGATDTFIYYAMEFIEYGDLGAQLKKGPLQKEKAISIFRQIASGLKALHEKGIVHRDIKSNNILFKDEDNIVIADLGSAKNLNQNIELTIHGQVIGTPFYMSPEQFNSTPIDHKSDIYSLGILFYEMIVGEKPFTGNNIMEIVHKHLFEEIPSLPKRLDSYNNFLQKLIAKDPVDRFNIIDDVISEIDNLQGE